MRSGNEQSTGKMGGTPMRRATPLAFVVLTFSLAGCGGLLGGGGTPHAAPATKAPTSSERARAATSAFTKVLATVKQEPATTFKLTYTVDSASIPGHVTLEQMPPKQLFKWQDTEVLFTGKDAYYCTTQPALSCNAPGYFTTSPIQEILNVFSAATYVNDIESWQQLVSSGRSGYQVSLTHRTFAGQPSDCVSWDYQGSSLKYCLTNNGVLAYAGLSRTHGGSSYSFWLSNYSTRVKASDFTLPKGDELRVAPAAVTHG